MNIFILTDDDHVSDNMNLDDLFEKKEKFLSPNYICILKFLI